MVKKPVRRIIERYFRSLTDAGLPVDRVILFGSYARGEDTKDSDIDLCVVSKRFGKNRLDEIGFLLTHARMVDCRIEAIPASPKAWRNDELSPILHEVRKYGIPIRFSYPNK